MNNDGTISNCYNIGNITVAGIVYNNNSTGIISNSYYLENCASKFYNSNKGTIQEECTSKIEMEMKDRNFVSILNKGEDVFMHNTNNINNGYPILKWQIDN